MWLVTGAAGFIGSHMVEELLRRGERVRGLDDLSTGHESNIDEAIESAGAGARERFELIRGDIASFDTCARAVSGADRVVHLAALASVPLSIERPCRTFLVNEQGSVNVFEAARLEGLKNVVYASSSAVYGDAPKMPLEEADAREAVPLSPYALSKANVERIAAIYSELYGMTFVGMRYFNVYGRRQDPNGAYAAVIPRWLQALANGERPTIFGDGSATRDFCHVGDVVRANIAASGLGRQGSFVVNVAGGRRISLNELFEIVRTASGAPSDMRPIYADRRAGDIVHSFASIDAARELLGTAPKMRLEDGIADAARWYGDRAS